MPKPMAEAAIANREIVEIALEEEIPQRNICMVYDIHQPISAAARELKKLYQTAIRCDWQSVGYT